MTPISLIKENVTWLGAVASKLYKIGLDAHQMTCTCLNVLNNGGKMDERINTMIIIFKGVICEN